MEGETRGCRTRVQQTVRLAAGLVTRALLALVATLLATAAVVPLVTGWTPVVVSSGSMAPALAAGDVALVDPEIGYPAATGAVLVFRETGGRSLVVHRVAGGDAEGGYRTKGDANAAADSDLTPRDRVVGRVRVVVPLIGLPVAWHSGGRPDLVVATLLVVAALGGGALRAVRRSRRAARRRPGVLRRPASTRLAVLGLGVAPLIALGVAENPGPRAAGAAFTATTDNAANSLATLKPWYLKTNAAGDTVSSATLPLTTAVPTLTTLYNYDTNRNAIPGLSLAKGTGVAETDSTKIQKWNLSVTSSLVLSGTGRLRLWTALKDFHTTKTGSMQVGIFDCNSAGTTCTQIATSTLTTTGSWSGGSATWVRKEWNLGTISYTVSANRILQVRVAVLSGSGEDMLVAYDTTTYRSWFGVS